MADAVTIPAQVRDPQKNKGTGTRVARRLRAQGRVPAIIYGHKQTPVPISLARADVQQMIKRASHARAPLMRARCHADQSSSTKAASVSNGIVTKIVG